MSKTFKEVFKEEQELEKGLADLWGYSLASTSLDQKQKRQKQISPPVVANITLRKFGKEIPKTERIKQVQDQIRALHNEKKLMEEQEKAVLAAQKGEPIQLAQNKLIQWMQNIVEEYNSILAHRHLMKQSTFHQFSKHSELQSTVEDILRRIEEKKQELKHSDLKTQININREIASLYRQFYNNKKKPNSAVGYYKTRTMMPEPPRSFHHSLNKDRSNGTMMQHSRNHPGRLTSLNYSASDIQLLDSIENKRKVSSKEYESRLEAKTNVVLKKYKETQYKKQYVNSRNAQRNNHPASEFSKELKGRSLEGKGKRVKLEKDMLTPYVDSKDITAFREMETKIKSNNEALEIWKGKVNEVCNTSRVIKKMQESAKLKNIAEDKEANDLIKREVQLAKIIDQNVKIFSMDDEVDQQGSKDYQIEIKSKQKKQEDIFAELLRKRNNKFNKLWGTKILVKYDSRSEAKQMLRGDSEKNPNSSRKLIDQSDRTSPSRQKKINGTNQPLAEEKINLATWLQEANDQEHYERTCKNQKINLLLKHR